MRGIIIALVTFLGGLFPFMLFMFPEKMYFGDTTVFFGQYESDFYQVLRVIGTAAIGLGIINIVRVHAPQIIKRRPGWYNSAALFLGIGIMLFFGFWEGYGIKYQWQTKELASNMFRKILYGQMFVAMSSAMFSLLAFYIVNAAYRSFRIKSGEALFMMVAAMLVMIGQIPIGAKMSFFFPYAKEWLMVHINTPAYRAVFFRSMIAGFALSMRVWFSMERGGYFETD